MDGAGAGWVGHREGQLARAGWGWRLAAAGGAAVGRLPAAEEARWRAAPCSRRHGWGDREQKEGRMMLWDLHVSELERGEER